MDHKIWVVVCVDRTAVTHAADSASCCEEGEEILVDLKFRRALLAEEVLGSEVGWDSVVNCSVNSRQ